MIPHNSHILQKDTNRIVCSVCIATYKRLPLLEKLLQSLQSQILPNNVFQEVIVVDNDSDQSSLPILKKYKDGNNIQFRFFCQPEKNISLARNLAVKNASGNYILFIDDDETASPTWISDLLNAMHVYNADGVFGMVIPLFDEKFPDWLRQRSFFYSPVSLTGTETRYHFTSNCIVKAGLLKNLKDPFDYRYGLTGSEDAHLFEKLAMQGAYFVNCREAVVYEYLPEEKAGISYLFKRALKGGNAHARRSIEFAGTKHFYKRFNMFFKGMVFGLISVVLFIVLMPNRVRSTFWLFKIASNYGRMMAVFGRIYQAYK